MKIHIHAKEQSEMAANTETIETELDRLAGYGFTSEEIDSLRGLQEWYQTKGSDRVVLVRRWEFLRFLVNNGMLDV